MHLKRVTASRKMLTASSDCELLGTPPTDKLHTTALPSLVSDQPHYAICQDPVKSYSRLASRRSIRRPQRSPSSLQHITELLDMPCKLGRKHAEGTCNCALRSQPVGQVTPFRFAHIAVVVSLVSNSPTTVSACAVLGRARLSARSMRRRSTG